MSDEESAKLNRIAAQHDTHVDFDGVLAHFSGVLIAARLQGGEVLEAGCSTGVMTPMLLAKAGTLTVVEGSALYAQKVKAEFGDRLTMHCSLFEEFSPPRPFDAVVAGNVLHHMSDPLGLIRRMSGWLKEGGSLHLTVPNINAFHRQLGVAMGVADSVAATSERNRLFQQPGRFNQESLKQLVREAGLTLVHSEGFFFKPFPHDLMNHLTLSPAMLDGLFKMGRRYPEMACQLYIHAKKTSSL
jgi:2-polyprenyl-3-methyl-5-hydroxy-6-metoxy-1,4-benzoquinol methylase